MQICEYFFENACYSVTKYYLCKQNNKRSLLGRKQRHQVVRSFPNRYLFSLTNKLTFLFPISCILDIILRCNHGSFASSIGLFQAHFQPRKRANKFQTTDYQHLASIVKNRLFMTEWLFVANIANRKAENEQIV